ncbi:hypothetical protein ACKWTF_014846 [Chironomus riparius]
MKILSTLILLATLFTSSLTLNITCRFTTKKGDYACTVTKIVASSPTDTTVTSVDGRQQKDKTTDDVKIFEARGKNLKRFPLELGAFLPNLEVIAIERGLTEIHKEDLEQFPSLRKLYLSKNEIQDIESELFVNNPELELIFLGNNKIKSVAAEVFDGLENLQHLGFERNKCFTAAVENNRDGVLKLIQNIYQKCSTAAVSTGSSIGAAAGTTTIKSTTVESTGEEEEIPEETEEEAIKMS